MTETSPAQGAPIPPGQPGYLIATAARAPSVHNTQPWRFKTTSEAIELYADPHRKLHTDQPGREMLVSCGAALFGLRLAVRSLGHLPVVETFPDPGRLRLLARVSIGAAAPIGKGERQLLAAVPHRHTHRGPFEADPLPAGLLPRLQHDALAEGATLVTVRPALSYERLADIVSTAARRLDLDPVARAEVRRWSRAVGSASRDGVPAHAFPAGPGHQRGRLRQRDFDQGRGLAQLSAEGAPPGATAVLVTTGDTRADWLRAGQALHRLLLRAAASWVFASLYTQPLEAAPIRELIRDRLALPGNPQMLLQFGVARTAQATARRPPADISEP
jgi:nitroreductase